MYYEALHNTHRSDSIYTHKEKFHCYKVIENHEKTSSILENDLANQHKGLVTRDLFPSVSPSQLVF